MGTPAPPPAGGGIGGALSRVVSQVAATRAAPAPVQPLGGAFDELDDIDDILGGPQALPLPSMPNGRCAPANAPVFASCFEPVLFSVTQERFWPGCRAAGCPCCCCAARKVRARR
jgi:hypothetical protein